MAIDFKDVLAEKKPLIWAEIQKYLPMHSENPCPLDRVDQYKKEDKFHWEITSEYPRRQGKYIRPTLVLLSCEALGAPQEKAMLTAAAMQTSEDWILNHDDWEDGSRERRGKPCLHRIYGDALAVNAGDTLHAIMWKMLFDNYKLLGERKGTEVFDEFYKMIMRTMLGQTVEITWTQENKLDLTDEDIYFVVGGKTSYYTIAGPLRLGAIIAGANKQQLDKLFEMGTYLGRAFQITDDILDITSDYGGAKKQIGNDIYEGKRTLLLAHLLRTASASDKEKAIKIISKKREEKSEEEVMQVIDLMKKYGTIDYCRKRAEELADKTEKIFNTIDFFTNNAAKERLRAGIRFMIQRTI